MILFMVFDFKRNADIGFNLIGIISLVELFFYVLFQFLKKKIRIITLEKIDLGFILNLIWRLGIAGLNFIFLFNLKDIPYNAENSMLVFGTIAILT